jgi:hypothetical protein
MKHLVPQLALSPIHFALKAKVFRPEGLKKLERGDITICQNQIFLIEQKNSFRFMGYQIKDKIAEVRET